VADIAELYQPCTAVDAKPGLSEAAARLLADEQAALRAVIVERALRHGHAPQVVPRYVDGEQVGTEVLAVEFRARADAIQERQARALRTELELVQTLDQTQTLSTTLPL